MTLDSMLASTLYATGESQSHQEIFRYRALVNSLALRAITVGVYSCMEYRFGTSYLAARQTEVFKLPHDANLHRRLAVGHCLVY